MPEMASIPFRQISLEVLLTRLKQGKMCFGAKHRGQIVAFSWCDLESFFFKGLPFKLRDDEAFLFDAHTLEAFRGRAIAPYLRYQQYKELAGLGRHKLYSISGRYNASWLKFKRKLNARLIGAGLLIELFDKWHFSSVSEKHIIRD
jgi:hypothetical protein